MNEELLKPFTSEERLNNKRCLVIRCKGLSILRELVFSKDNVINYLKG
jgi:hypothetical protein